MPSGKQILLKVLSEISQGTVPPGTKEEISEKIRAALLLHGSTASDLWPAVEHIHWGTENDERAQPVRCGITYDGIFLSDLFEELTRPDGIPPHVACKYPGLSPQRYREAVRFTWLILSSVQWFEELAPVEDEADTNATGDALLANYIQKLQHFRKHPEDFR